MMMMMMMIFTAAVTGIIGTARWATQYVKEKRMVRVKFSLKSIF